METGRHRPISICQHTLDRPRHAHPHRKLIGGAALIVLVVSWALVAMALAQLPVIKSNGIVEAIYYVLAALGWVLPAMPLIKWMSVDGRQRTDAG